MSTDEHLGTVKVRKTYSKKTGRPDEDSSADLEVATFAEGTHPAFVRASTGLTINLGNFESARVDVSVTLPCYPEEVREAFGRAWHIVETELQANVAGTPGATAKAKLDNRRRD